MEVLSWSELILSEAQLACLKAAVTIGSEGLRRSGGAYVLATRY
jgi:hypothetical protein